MKGFKKFAAVTKKRNAAKDVMFSPVIVEHRKTRTCCLDGCNNHLTEYKGPGSKSLCREHQLTLREYGGPGRTDRPWTFWKKDHCECCGHDPKTNPQIVKLKEPMRTIVARMMLHVDHVKAGRQDKYKNANGVNHPKNLRTLCMECHMLKTYKDGDHWSEEKHG